MGMVGAKAREMLEGANSTGIWGPVPPYREPIIAIIVVFLSSQNSQKGPKMPLFGHFSAKNFSASGGLAPDLLTRRSASGPR